MPFRRPDVTQSRRWLVPVCFFLSGAAGLVFEIVWSRYLSLLLGNSIQGVSTVVAAFLGGLGLGAWVGGRRASRTADPLATYARIELLIGAAGLASPLAYLAARPLFTSLYAMMDGSGSLFHSLRFLVLFAALLPPTIAMGATLPLLVSDLERRGGSPRSTVGLLYAINTAGAVAGVLCAAFVLVPGLGLWRTAVAASTIDFAVAAAILLGPRSVAHRAPVMSDPAPTRRPKLLLEEESVPPRPSRSMSRVIVSCMTLSGFAAILYQVAWVRILSVSMGGMVYTLAVILALYLLGLTTGSIAAARLLRRGHDAVRLFTLFQIGAASTVAAGTWMFVRLPEWQAAVLIGSRGSAMSVLAGDGVIAALIVLAPTFCLGALFPAAAAIVREGRSEGASSVGVIYAANTVGSIAGSLLTGFVLIPAIGALRAILAAACVNMAIGVVTALAGLRNRRQALAIAAAASAASVLFGVAARPGWDEWRMTLGLGRLLRTYRGGGEAMVREVVSEGSSVRAKEKVLFYREGSHANVTVLDVEGMRVLFVNGKADASIGEDQDMTTQVLLGHMPVLLLPRPVGEAVPSVCIVGYGSGVTTHAVLTHPVGRVVTVELERAVIDAAPEFRDAAHDPLSDPRSRLIVEDAGLFLRSTPEKFDAIISEPSNPWVSGVGSLFSRGFYEASKSRLAPKGVFCQWIQGYEISPEMLHTIFRTLAATFPSGHVFYFNPAHDFAVLASPEPGLPLDVESLRAAFDRREVAEDLARIGVHGAEDLLRHYRGRLDRIAREAGPGPLNTDDNAWLEHRAPLDMLGLGPPTPPLEWDDKVAADLASSISGPSEEAGQMLRAAAERAADKNDRGAANGLLAAASRLAAEGGSAERARSYTEIAKLNEDAERAGAILASALPILHQASEAGDQAAGERVYTMLAEAHDLDPSNGEIVWRLGTALIVARRAEAAVAMLRNALTLLPTSQHFAVHRDLAIAHYSLDAGDDTLRELDEMERLMPRTAEAQYWRARVYKDRGDAKQARRAIDRGLQDHPGDARLVSLRSDRR